MQKSLPSDLALGLEMARLRLAMGALAQTPGLERLEDGKMSLPDLRELRKSLNGLKDATIKTISAVGECITDRVRCHGDTAISYWDDLSKATLPQSLFDLCPFKDLDGKVSMWLGAEDQYDEMMERVFAAAVPKLSDSAFYRRDGQCVAFQITRSAPQRAPLSDAHAYANMGDDSAH